MLDVTVFAGDEAYASPFIGPVTHPLHCNVDPAGLTTAEVDELGYLKPGIPFDIAGALIAAGPTVVFGVTIEATKLKLATIPPTDVSLAAETDTTLVAVQAAGIPINRDIAEEQLGRSYTADELAGLAAANFTVTPT